MIEAQFHLPIVSAIKRIGNNFYRIVLYGLCRYASGWRGMWRLKLGKRITAYRFDKPGTLITNTKWGVPIEVRKNDVTGHFVYFYGDYEKKLLMAARRELKPGDVALDIGANIGIVSLFFMTLVGKTGRVFSVEPLKQNFDLLQRNIHRAGCGDLIFAEQYALGAEARDITIQFDENTDNWGSTSLYNQSGNSKQQVRMARLDALWESWGKPRIQLAKMDVEGFEHEVLKGATTLMKESPPRVWIVEFNMEHLSQLEDGVANLWNFFLSHSYAPYHMKTQGRLDRMPSEHCDVLFRLER